LPDLGNWAACFVSFSIAVALVAPVYVKRSLTACHGDSKPEVDVLLLTKIWPLNSFNPGGEEGFNLIVTSLGVVCHPNELWGLTWQYLH